MNTHSIGSADAETLIPETEDTARQGTRELCQGNFRTSTAEIQSKSIWPRATSTGGGKGKASDIALKIITVTMKLS